MSHLNDVVPYSKLAEITARVDAGESRSVVLAEYGLAENIFLDAQRAWLAKIGEEVLRGEFKLQRQYSAQYLAYLKLAQSKPAPAAEVPEASSPAWDDFPEPALAAPPAPVQPPLASPSVPVQSPFAPPAGPAQLDSLEEPPLFDAEAMRQLAEPPLATAPQSAHSSPEPPPARAPAHASIEDEPAVVSPAGSSGTTAASPAGSSGATAAAGRIGGSTIALAGAHLASPEPRKKMPASFSATGFQISPAGGTAAEPPAQPAAPPAQAMAHPAPYTQPQPPAPREPSAPSPQQPAAYPPTQFAQPQVPPSVSSANSAHAAPAGAEDFYSGQGQDVAPPAHVAHVNAPQRTQPSLKPLPDRLDFGRFGGTSQSAGRPPGPNHAPAAAPTPLHTPGFATGGGREGAPPAWGGARAVPAAAPTAVPAAAPTAAAPPPFPSHSEPQGSYQQSLSLEQIACIQAELDTQPARKEQILASNQLSPSSYDHQYSLLERELSSDAAKAARFAHLREYYRAIVGS